MQVNNDSPMENAYQQKLMALKRLEAEFVSTFEPVLTCPVCGCATASHVSSQFIRMGSRIPYAKSQRNLVSCNRCGVVRVDGIFADEYYGHYINMFYDVNPDKVQPYSFNKAEIRFAIVRAGLQKFNIAPRAIFEASSFDGVTLAMFRKGFGVEVAGIEPTAAAVKLSIHLFPELAGCVHQELFEQAIDKIGASRKFDVVCFSYCFRQIARPLKALANLRAMLNPGGLVLIDEGSLLEDFINFGHEFALREFFGQKNFYYSSAALTYLFEKNGFELARTVRHHDHTMRYHALLFRYIGTVSANLKRIEISKRSADFAVNFFHESYHSDEDIQQAVKDG